MQKQLLKFRKDQILSKNIREDILKNSPKDNKDYCGTESGIRVMTDITNLTLTELVKKLKSKEICSTDITSNYIERSKSSKKLNAYIEETFDDALANSKKFDAKPDLEKTSRHSYSS